MTDDDEVTPTMPLVVWPHPAAMEADERLPAAYLPALRIPRNEGVDPAFAVWDWRARFAPPGPSFASMAAPAFTIALGPDPADWAAYADPPSPDLPEAWLDESAVLERIADIADPDAVEHDRADAGLRYDDAVLDQPPAEVDHWPPQDEPNFDERHDPPPIEVDAASLRATERPVRDVAPDHPAPEAADDRTKSPGAAPIGDAPKAAYWATAPDLPREVGGGLAWAPPPTTGPGQRATPAMAGLWAAEPTGSAVDFNEAPVERRARRPLPRLVKVVAGIAVLAAACVACVILLPRLLANRGNPTATFNAPMMVLRAAGMGRVTNVAVKNGQTVEPSTLLLTIHTDPQPDPGTTLLQDRLEAARSRLASLDDGLAQPVPNTDAGRARTAELRRQRATALTDVTQLQEGLAAIPVKAPADQPVLAGVHGVIRSLEAQAGGLTTSGVPLVRMLDCDHAFLTVGPDAKLQPGQAVLVKLANLPAVPAVVRKSAGIAEPPDSLVIAPAPGAFVQILSGACPIGATATVTPATAGS